MRQLRSKFASESKSHAGTARRASGFTLIELMVATAVFLVVAGAAFSVFDSHMASITREENLSGVNLALRNATSQLQLDLAGAGQNLLAGLGNNQAFFSAGVNIQNSVPGTAAACTPTGTNFDYPVPSACFDALTIFGAHAGCTVSGTGFPSGLPPVLILQDPNGASESVSSSSTLYANDAEDPSVVATLTADKNCFNAGDELLIIQYPTGGSTLPCTNASFTYCISAVTLTQVPTVTDQNNQELLQLTHSVTASSGDPAGCPGASCTDPQGVLVNVNATHGYNFYNALASSFTTGAYIVDIGSSTSAITYSVQVSSTNADDTQLVRCDSNGCAVLADQVIGFKVGAALWNNETVGQAEIANYFYNANAYCSEWSGANCNASSPPANDPDDFSLIRAIRVSLIGRTAPFQDPSLDNFANGFDGGPYLVQQASTVVDLRNLSITDFQN